MIVIVHQHEGVNLQDKTFRQLAHQAWEAAPIRVTPDTARCPGGTVVAGQQFQYGFDDIGNRLMAGSGGDEYGGNLGYQFYAANNLNQYTQRTVPGKVNVLGTATNTATVTVNLQPTYRKGDYYRAELSVENSAAALWVGVTNVAVLNNGANPDIVATNQGNVFVPKTPEVFSYDGDGNLTNDGRWAYTWDAENRLVSMTAGSAIPTGARLALAFAYDFQSRRVSKTVSNWTGSAWSLTLQRKFLYDGWNLIAEADNANAMVRHYMWGSDLRGSRVGAGGVGGLVKVYDASLDKHFFPGYDGNGNVAVLVEGTTGLAWANYEYGPFGELIRANGSMARLNPFRFSTKYCGGACCAVELVLI